LTADAKQKISLGRGMVQRRRGFLLFDEPLTVIDTHEVGIAHATQILHHEFGHTMIYAVARN
jgi:glycerol transport system ATP-binding protein